MNHISTLLNIKINTFFPYDNGLNNKVITSASVVLAGEKVMPHRILASFKAIFLKVDTKSGLSIYEPDWIIYNSA